MVAMIVAVATPGLDVMAVLVGGPGSSTLLPHFFCCRHKMLAIIVFEGVAAACCAAGIIALIRIWLSQGLRGMLPAIIAVVAGAASTVFGACALGLIRN
jgi:hypothetical protein